MKAEDVNFLIESGLLFEVNRRVLHPLGLALGLGLPLRAETDAGSALLRVADPEGFVYSEADLEDGFARLRAFMKAEGYARLAARYDVFGFRGQVPEDADPNADERDWTPARRRLTQAARDVVAAARELAAEIPRYIVTIENGSLSGEEVERLRLLVREADGDAGKMEGVVREFNLDGRRISATRTRRDVTADLDDLRAALRVLDSGETAREPSPAEFDLSYTVGEDGVDSGETAGASGSLDKLQAAFDALPKGEFRPIAVREACEEAIAKASAELDFDPKAAERDLERLNEELRIEDGGEGAARESIGCVCEGDGCLSCEGEVDDA